MYNVVLVRYGEISVKSPKVRRKMEDSLVKSIEDKLLASGIEKFELKRKRGRIFIYSTDDLKKISSIVSRIFGITSTSPAIEVSNDLSEITDKVIELAKTKLREGMSFAIRARRVKSYPLTSKDIERILGDRVLKAFNSKVKVDLEKPDVTIYVEVREKKAYIFTELIRGVGGLPYGVEGKLIALISGGIDSAVASWLVMKRGCKVVPIFFNLSPFMSEEAINRAYNVLKWLRSWVPERKFYAYIVPLGEFHSKVKGINERYRCLLCKTMMYKVAERICELEKAKGIVTGESIGQVASQTLDNLYHLSRMVNVPIYRPVVGLDKNEIIDLARRINVFEIAGKAVVACTLAPKYPITHATKTFYNIINEVISESTIEELISKTEKYFID